MRWDISNRLRTKADILEYLGEVLSTGDRALIALALFNIGRSEYVNGLPPDSDAVACDAGAPGAGSDLGGSVRRVAGRQ
jgi:hypothetical protein